MKIIGRPLKILTCLLDHGIDISHFGEKCTLTICDDTTDSKFIIDVNNYKVKVFPRESNVRLFLEALQKESQSTSDQRLSPKWGQIEKILKTILHRRFSLQKTSIPMA